MEEQNLPPADGKPEAKLGVRIDDIPEGGGEVQPLLLLLVESIIVAHLGKRPFQVWQDNVEDLLDKLELLKGVNFRLCTLKKKKPYIKPKKLPLDWPAVKGYVHVHDNMKQSFFRTVG